MSWHLTHAYKFPSNSDPTALTVLTGNYYYRTVRMTHRTSQDFFVKKKKEKKNKMIESGTKDVLNTIF